ncbi:MAG: AbrB family transcriptional regulator, transcriptional pleiotropic regulator of transition state [Eubacteriales bacterium]|nr:AbrB family transcriptional regulator, transcriptional pleiotropic regulator of transition state [Eubacteriales bacterium]MDN5363297.1 AbrB family transcriptional regulator, transcriptional pleiotropic regulator of transition state [Eubacteriales bacterium]
MKATGIVRPVDELGRVVLPKELRRIMNINEKDGMEIFVEGDKIILRKYQPSCIFCNSLDDVFTFRNRLICKKCALELAESAK